jgi:hypothetical protein
VLQSLGRLGRLPSRVSHQPSEYFLGSRQEGVFASRIFLKIDVQITGGFHVRHLRKCLGHQ